MALSANLSWHGMAFVDFSIAPFIVQCNSHNK